MAFALATGCGLDEAILYVAGLCERCMNALAYECGLPWGYPRYSREWGRSRTSCRACDLELDRMEVP